MSKQFPISLDNLIDNYLTDNYIYRPTNHKGMSQRVFKGPIGVIYLFIKTLFIVGT